jgi:quercetin dioxygenase-like cupin family protein
MYHVRQENLPFVGSSHEFIGAEAGQHQFSLFLFHGKPGSGPGPHRHPDDEIQLIREGRGVWTVSGKTFEGSAGDIFVIKPGEIHSFKAVGDFTTGAIRRSPQSPLYPREPIEQWVATWLGPAALGKTQALFLSWRNIAIALIDADRPILGL